MKTKIKLNEQTVQLRDLGLKIRNHRKEFGLSATTTAEAADISRITLHRIEKGEGSVSMGAYISVAISLGLEIGLSNTKKSQNESSSQQKLPKKIRVNDYPQLKSLAWQINKKHDLTPEEALNIYERNWRHIDQKSISIKEKKIIDLLLAHFERKRLLV